MNSASSQTITPERLAKLEYLADRQEILDCLARALRAIDRFDKELFLTCFHSDAVIDAGGFLNAPGVVYDGAADLHQRGQLSTIHNLLNHTCEIDGDVAHSETYLLYTGVNRDKTNWIAGGRYLDRLERRDGSWKIAFRYTLMEWSGVVAPTDNPMFENISD